MSMLNPSLSGVALVYALVHAGASKFAHSQQEPLDHSVWIEH
jgi:hypothetical protein